MLRKAAFALMLTLLPAVASAQEHNHGESADKTPHTNMAAAKPGKEVNFAALVMEKRAELNLTEEQVAKLEDISAMMAQHHASMSKPGAKVEDADHARMHEAFMSIFTEEQAVKVRQIMKDYTDKCGGGADKQCRVEPKKKVQLQ